MIGVIVILIGVIAVGVLLQSKEGKKILKIIGIVCLVILVLVIDIWLISFIYNEKQQLSQEHTETTCSELDSKMTYTSEEFKFLRDNC